MGIFSKLKKLNLRDVVGKVGDIGKFAAGFLPPGLQQVVGAAAGAAGQLNDKDELGHYKDISLGSTLGAGLKGAGAATLGGALRGGISAGIHGGNILAGAGQASGLSRLPAPPGINGAAGTGIKSAGSSLLSHGLDWAKKNPELAIAGITALSAAKQGGKAGDINDEILKIARAREAANAPLRALMLQRLSTLGQNAPARISLRDAGNVYS